MSCKNCGQRDFSKVISICRVCSILDDDITQKPVTFCDICNSYICASCITDWGRRAKAAALNWLNPKKDV